ncbi:MAG TPA: 3-hydroxybutyrate dehydrogenase [Thermoanaerobaculia bacterium]|nr:3-hydroxybutyrate dehydrogenase [Thermoanaerobaculia bacterium]
MRMRDRVALVTGAGSGIGREIARAFAREGARVGVADIASGPASKVAAEIESAGGSALAMAMDVSQEDQVEAAVERLAARFGSVDVLVSNAGTQHIAAVVDLAFAEWKKMLAIQLDGAFLTTRACLRHMYRSGRGGVVLYMGSVHSKEASVLKAPYVTAKHGLLGLARVVAKEGAPHSVRANVICPGFVRTPLVDKQIPEQASLLGLSEEDVVKKVMLKETVDGQFTTTADVAELAVFLASFPSNALNGQSVVVSHGWHMA